MRGLLLGCWLVIMSLSPALAKVYECPDGQGGIYIQDQPCNVRVPENGALPLPPASANTQTVAPIMRRESTDKVIPAFPSGGTYYTSLFDYRTSDTERIRLPRAVSEKQALACLDRYRGSLNDPRSPYIQEAAVTQRTWKSSHGNVRQAIEILLDARAKNKFGGYIQVIFSCPLTTDDEIDDEGMKGHLAAFHLGSPIQ